ncbi:hypothetical protein B4133_2856 [Bacillus altitudinis]|nr:hypothetical protein B4133_2856 [Bacillus altitudinis]
MSDKNEQAVTEASHEIVVNKKAPDVFHPTLFPMTCSALIFMHHVSFALCILYAIS